MSFPKLPPVYINEDEAYRNIAIGFNQYLRSIASAQKRVALQYPSTEEAWRKLALSINKALDSAISPYPRLSVKPGAYRDLTNAVNVLNGY